MDLNFLDFEQPIAELEAKIEELRLVGHDNEINIQEEIERLQKKSRALTESIFAGLTPWQISQLSRHPQRPYLLDYMRRIFDEFHELHGDRAFADDPAIVGGLARMDGRPVMVIGHQKGRDTKEKIHRNFGMPRPEGYRKALRLMEMAERFRLPILTFIDTPGAYPGVGAEERGQSEAIARNLQVMSRLRTPILCTVVGEGGSGGALAIGVGDRLLMLQYSTYSVISPEGCASILWKSADKAQLAAEAMAITSDKLKELGLVDLVIPEPLGGAHRDPDAMAATAQDGPAGAAGHPPGRGPGRPGGRALRAPDGLRPVQGIAAQSRSQVSPGGRQLAPMARLRSRVLVRRARPLAPAGACLGRLQRRARLHASCCAPRPAVRERLPGALARRPYRPRSAPGLPPLGRALPGGLRGPGDPPGQPPAGSRPEPGREPGGRRPGRPLRRLREPCSRPATCCSPPTTRTTRPRPCCWP